MQHGNGYLSDRIEASDFVTRIYFNKHELLDDNGHLWKDMPLATSICQAPSDHVDSKELR